MSKPVKIYVLNRLHPWNSSLRLFWFLSFSWHQTSKQTILFTPIFSTNFSHFLKAVEKENKLFIGPKLRKNLFWTNNNFFYRSNLWKKLGKTKFVFWWFDMPRTRYLNFGEIRETFGHHFVLWKIRTFKHANMTFFLPFSNKIWQILRKQIIFWKQHRFTKF